MSEPLVLQEADAERLVRIPRHVAIELTRLGICDAAATAVEDEWLIGRVRKVGVLRVGDLQVQIQPKTSIKNLLFMLQYEAGAATWRDDSVHVQEGEVLTDALARAYARTLERATARGLTKGYRSVEESGMVLRGRWDIARQLRVRRGALMPAEMERDEFDVDTSENRILLAAAGRLLRLPGISVGAAAQLRTLVARFEGVTQLPRGGEHQSPATTRLNAHLAPALALARAVLDRRSIEHQIGPLGGIAFLVTTATVFERFVTAVVIEHARHLGYEAKAQFESSLDMAGEVRIKPDLVVFEHGRPIAILDAKYKQETVAGFPNADIYQGLAYAIRHRLNRVHLLYAKGFGRATQIRIDEANVIVQWTRSTSP